MKLILLLKTLILRKRIEKLESTIRTLREVIKVKNFILEANRISKDQAYAKIALVENTATKLRKAVCSKENIEKYKKVKKEEKLLEIQELKKQLSPLKEKMESYLRRKFTIMSRVVNFKDFKIDFDLENCEKK